MNNIYTEEKLIAFYYEECDTLETFEIEDAIENDQKLNLNYFNISNELIALNHLSLQPKCNSINKILAYSKSCS
jgi:hypothetical protein